MPRKLYKIVDDVRVMNFFHEENLRSAINYKPVAGDTFVATYPRCGTTWMMHIVSRILTMSLPPENPMTRIHRMPYLDLLGSESAEKMLRPGVIKTHLPFHKVPYSDDAKYICVARNPYDCCVSCYYHNKGMPSSNFEEGSLDEFIDLFVQGEVPRGCYFEHLLPWYEQRGRPNVLFMTYESLKKDTRSWLFKIADFLGEEYGSTLRRDPSQLQKILRATGAGEMREVMAIGYEKILQHLLDLPPENALVSAEPYRHLLHRQRPILYNGDFVRKAEVGDWRKHLSDEQVEKIKGWIARKAQHTGIMELWKDTDIP